MKLLQTVFYINVEGVPAKNFKEYMEKIKAELMSPEAPEEKDLAKVPCLIRRTFILPVWGQQPTQVVTEVCELG